MARAQSLKQSAEETPARKCQVDSSTKCLKMTLLNATFLLLMQQQKTGILLTQLLGHLTMKTHQHTLDIFKTTAIREHKTYMGFDHPNNAAAAWQVLKTLMLFG